MIRILLLLGSGTVELLNMELGIARQFNEGANSDFDAGV
jgi:hypothetical protein